MLETLIALAVGALVLVALYGAVTRAAVTRARVIRRAARTTATRTVLLRIAQEVEGALPVPAPGAPERFVVVPPEDGRPPWSELRFAATGDDGVDLVRYRVDPPGRLTRGAASRFAPPDTPEPEGVTLLDGLRLFRVRCFDGAVWRAVWTAPQLPHAIELALGVDDGAGGVEELTTAVSLPLGGS